jgi:hypothetical protein
MEMEMEMEKEKGKDKKNESDRIPERGAELAVEPGQLEQVAGAPQVVLELRVVEEGELEAGEERRGGLEAELQPQGAGDPQVRQAGGDLHQGDLQPRLAGVGDGQVQDQAAGARLPDGDALHHGRRLAQLNGLQPESMNEISGQQLPHQGLHLLLGHP